MQSQAHTEAHRGYPMHSIQCPSRLSCMCTASTHRVDGLAPPAQPSVVPSNIAPSPVRRSHTPCFAPRTAPCNPLYPMPFSSLLRVLVSPACAPLAYTLWMALLPPCSHYFFSWWSPRHALQMALSPCATPFLCVPCLPCPSPVHHRLTRSRCHGFLLAARGRPLEPRLPQA